MKIVDRKTFLALPADTLFSKYQPCAFGELQIKGDAFGTNDFWVYEIADAVRFDDSDEFVTTMLEAQRTGASVSMDFDTCTRDGMFDEGQLFAIWEPADVAALIERLSRTIAPPQETPMDLDKLVSDIRSSSLAFLDASASILAGAANCDDNRSPMVWAATLTIGPARTICELFSIAYNEGDWPVGGDALLRAIAHQHPQLVDEYQLPWP